MLNKLVIVIIIVILFISCADKKISTSSMDEETKLLICNSLTKDINNFILNSPAKKIGIFGRAFLDPKKDGTFDKEIFKNRLFKSFPNKNLEGIILLDLEGINFINILRGSKEEKKKSIDIFIEIIKYAKNLRPNVKFGYYGIPDRKYWHFNKKWEENISAWVEIIKHSDIIFPSVYKLYPDSVNGIEKENEYIYTNINRALIIKEQTKKPVFPVLSNRYHFGNKAHGMDLIPLEEFELYVERITKVQTENNTLIDGIVWWGADHYFFNKKRKKKEKKFLKFENFDEYIEPIFHDYFDVLIMKMYEN